MNWPITRRCAGRGIVSEQNNTFIIAAFAVTWVCVIGYAVHLYRARRVADARLREAQQTFGGRT